MSVQLALGYMIIDFVSPKFKYRINSLNMYYNVEHQQLRYIYGKTDDAIKMQNAVLKSRFQSFLANGKMKELNVEKDDDSDLETEPECPLCQECLPESNNLKDA